MKTSSFFTYLKTALQGVKIDLTTYLFGSNVYVVPVFPIEQINLFPSRCCFIIDAGANPHEFHPHIQSQAFTIGFFAEDIRDPFGEVAIQNCINIDEILHNFMLSIKSLNSEKVLIRLNSKTTATTIRNNFPLLVRYWVYDVLTEV